MKKRVLFGLVFILCISLCGCGEKTTSSPEINGESVNTGEAEMNKNLTEEVVSIYSYKPDTLCPLLSQNKANLNMLCLVFDGLFKVDEKLCATENLAKGYSASDENKKFTVELREDIYFHDGAHFSADDVIYSAKTIMDNPESPYSKNLSEVSSVKKIGKYKVEFSLKKPCYLFANLLDFPIIKNNSLKDGEEFSPIGTGAFKYENKNEGNRFHLIKNEKRNNGGLKSVQVRLLPDKDTALYAFSSGDISICPAEGEEWGKFVDSENSEYISYPTEYFMFLGFNMKNYILKNPEIRKAISYAAGVEEAFSSVVMDFGRGADFPINPSWGYKTEVSSEAFGTKAAREILEADGWKQKNGVYKKTSGRRTQSLKFSILYCSDSYRAEQLAKNVAERLTKFGIQTSVKEADYERYMGAIEKNSYDMFIGKTLMSKNLDLSVFFGKDNIFGEEDEELLAAEAELQTSKDEEEFGENLNNLKKLFSEKVPFAGFGFEDGILLVKKNLKDGLSPVTDNIYSGTDRIK